MKNKELIRLLQSFPEDMEVCIYDWKTNVKEDWGEGSSAGLYTKIEIEVVKDVVEGTKPFIALGFENEFIEE